ncbi:hypothetical protein [Gordonia terrae]|nr:hypothetical protein [Gordonia terrae]ANY25215.1 hypothetical protein BCM27_22505 [Gordonia terrae]GAB45558.1 hypothetical protein GOTRE_125_01960 [Gordonia terrae NBRC 100016]VTR08087.1 Uncharacterised protein [Clostridioides difficile]
MTAEAIVMNRSAVALAADSAVTISNRRTMKTYESANKLFELVKGSNIGVMVYSSATVDGTPWETVIKTYRQERGANPMPHVEDYAEDFIDFLAGHGGLITPAAELETALSLGYQFFLDQIIKRLVEWPDDLASSTGRIVQTRVKAALEEILNDLESEIDGLEDISADTTFPDSLHREFKDPITRLVEVELEENGLKVTRAQIRRAAALSSQKQCPRRAAFQATPASCSQASVPPITFPSGSPRESQVDSAAMWVATTKPL